MSQTAVLSAVINRGCALPRLRFANRGCALPRLRFAGRPYSRRGYNAVHYNGGGSLWY